MKWKVYKKYALLGSMNFNQTLYKSNQILWMFLLQSTCTLNIQLKVKSVLGQNNPQWYANQ